MSVYKQAAAADAEAAAELDSAMAGRRAALDRFVAGLDLPLGTSADRDDATAIARALTQNLSGRNDRPDGASQRV